MKIILQDEGKKSLRTDYDSEAGLEMALDDTPFDSPGWISLEIGRVSVAEVHIDDLYPAVIAFKERYERSMKHD